MIEAQFDQTLASWRGEARRLISRNIAPDQILWTRDAEPSLFQTSAMTDSRADLMPTTSLNVPSEFMTLARFVSCHKDPQRWALLYRLLYRFKNENRNLFHIQTDADVHLAQTMMKSVTKDIHKMHAFVRFKHVQRGDHELYIAWHRPEHFIVEEATPFFQRRFGDKPWCILTPDRSAFWDLKTLRFGDGVPEHKFEVQDDFDELWKTYYSAIFNPARIKIKAMKKEMATKYWATLPETEIIADLIQSAPFRLQEMAKNQNKQAQVPKRTSAQELMKDLKHCQACPLYLPSTQAVCGEGPNETEMMIVGEQPGDQEDLQGRPFVGPAGSVLDSAFKITGLDRDQIYLTNAVKHFKFERGDDGKARIHKRASGTEMHACKPWLEAELHLVKPRIVIALGVTAATSLLGRQPKLGEERGHIFTFKEKPYAVILSWHPASILRAIDADEARRKADELSQDLAKAKAFLENANQTASGPKFAEKPTP